MIVVVGRRSRVPAETAAYLLLLLVCPDSIIQEKIPSSRHCNLDRTVHNLGDKSSFHRAGGKIRVVGVAVRLRGQTFRQAGKRGTTKALAGMTVTTRRCRRRTLKQLDEISRWIGTPLFRDR